MMLSLQSPRTGTEASPGSPKGFLFSFCFPRPGRHHYPNYLAPAGRGSSGALSNGVRFSRVGRAQLAIGVLAPTTRRKNLPLPLSPTGKQRFGPHRKAVSENVPEKESHPLLVSIRAFVRSCVGLVFFLAFASPLLLLLSITHPKTVPLVHPPCPCPKP